MTATGTMKIDVGGSTAATFSSSGITGTQLGNVDAATATTLTVGAATATAVEIGDAGVTTDVQGPLTVLGTTGNGVDAAGATALYVGEATATSVVIGATDANAVIPGEATVDGKYAVVGPDATTALMVLSASITATSATLQTNAFATTFGAAPVVTATYTEDPGDVRPIWVSAVTASNVIFSITGDKNYAYTAVGARP
jgi:hypothetical protein